MTGWTKTVWNASKTLPDTSTHCQHRNSMPSALELDVLSTYPHAPIGPLLETTN